MKYQEKYVSGSEAVKKIRSGDRIFVHGSAQTPISLINELAKRAPELQNVEILAISTLGDMAISKPEYKKSFFVNSLFVSDNVRGVVNEGGGDYVPVFLSEIPRLFDLEILPIDVALIHVSAPDSHGFCSLGLSVDVAKAAVRNAEYIVAQVNPNVPRVHGDGFIHVNDIDALVKVEDELPEVLYSKLKTKAEETIGKFIAEMVEDRSTLQMGIGAIPDAVLSSLDHCKDLGVHSEMFSDGVINLIEKGIVTNRYKKKHPGKVVAAFAIGTRKLYDYVDDNPQFAFLEAGYVNDIRVIRSNPKVVAINSAIEIDLTGQVCADSIGKYQFSGVGGQMDFIRGASLSEGGKPIIALSSTTKKGTSKIVPFLKLGAGVVTTRAHVHYVVTEFGVAYLYGKNLKQRAEELARIAHPDHREELEKEISARFGTNHYSFRR